MTEDPTLLEILQTIWLSLLFGLGLGVGVALLATLLNVVVSTVGGPVLCILFCGAIGALLGTHKALYPKGKFDE